MDLRPLADVINRFQPSTTWCGTKSAPSEMRSKERTSDHLPASSGHDHTSQWAGARLRQPDRKGLSAPDDARTNVARNENIRATKDLEGKLKGSTLRQELHAFRVCHHLEPSLPSRPIRCRYQARRFERPRQHRDTRKHRHR